MEVVILTLIIAWMILKGHPDEQSRKDEEIRRELRELKRKGKL